MSEKVKCGDADKYKAISKPTCGCEICELKWQLKKAQKGDYEVEWKFPSDAEKVYCSTEINLHK